MVQIHSPRPTSFPCPLMSETVRMFVRVNGSVQGVGFRWYALRCAQHNGVAGWVRNMPDGSVEMEVEGDPAAVNAFIEDVRIGPATADVSEVNFHRIPVKGETSFEVKR